MGVRWTRKFNRFEEISAKVRANLAAAVRETAADVVEDAQAHAPVDTGALRASIHAVTDEKSDYGTAAQTAAGLRHSGNRSGSPAVILPEVRPKKPLHAIAASCVAHAWANEFGDTRMPARPFFIPAVEHARGRYFARVAAALKSKK